MSVPSDRHFHRYDTIDDAAELLVFAPHAPQDTAGCECLAIQVFVADHKHRTIPARDRSLELHYGDFVFTQAAPGRNEARRRVVDTRYGPTPIEAQILGREARLYELGPDPGPDDVDGRTPAVVTWHEDGIHYLLASTELLSQRLVDIAMSVHASA